jgi:hypothetical protein
MTKRIVSNPSKPPFDRAAKKAQLEERATEGAKAISEYNAAREAERAKTERLRALRLAKEATDRTKKNLDLPRWESLCGGESQRRGCLCRGKGIEFVIRAV